jgi:predicted PurR-regulated permease PerM
MVTVFLIVAVIFALNLILPVLQMLVFAVLFAFLLYIPARWIRRRTRLPWAAGVILLYLALIAAIVAIIIGIIPAFVDGLSLLRSTVEAGYEQLRNTLQSFDPATAIIEVGGFTVDLNPLIVPVRDFVLGTTPNVKDTTFAGQSVTSVNEVLSSIDLPGIVTRVLSFAGVITSAITSITGFVSTLLLAVFISFLIMLDLPQTDSSLTRWIPREYHREAALLFEKINRIWVGFFRGQVTIGFIVGVLTFIQLSILGIPGAVVLAIITGFISLIPTLGGFIALVPLAIVPLIQGSTTYPDVSNVTVALITVGINVVIQQVLWNSVAPKILGDALNLPIAVVIIGVFVGAAVGGILGAFLVAPVLSTAWVIITYLTRKVAQLDPFPGEEPIKPMGGDVEVLLNAPVEPREPAETTTSTPASQTM